jgi:hypothetical protein
LAFILYTAQHFSLYHHPLKPFWPFFFGLLLFLTLLAFSVFWAILKISAFPISPSFSIPRGISTFTILLNLFGLFSFGLFFFLAFSLRPFLLPFFFLASFLFGLFFFGLFFLAFSSLAFSFWPFFLLLPFLFNLFFLAFSSLAFSSLAFSSSAFS